jgi:hypothetical protein
MTYLRLPIGTRGKNSERLVKNALDKFNEEIFDFAWHRYPDTRASRGMIAAQPCDFLLACAGAAHHLEVKEIEDIREMRFPRKRLTQLPMLTKFAHAGISFGVLIHHPKRREWRFIGESVFFANDAPSIALTAYPAYPNAREALIGGSGWIPSSVNK